MAPRKRARRQEVDLGLALLPQGPPAKKLKTQHDSSTNTRDPLQRHPEFWDRLSKIELTAHSLGELDRRTKRPCARRTSFSRKGARHDVEDLARFSRHGGPDLSDLRGYPYPAERHLAYGTMSRKPSSEDGGISANPSSTQPTSTSTKSKKSTVYSRNFDQHLTDHAIEPLYSSEEPELDVITTSLALPRPSLSPSTFSESAFKEFRRHSALAKDEDDVLANVIPTILGPKTTVYPSARNTIFGNLEPLTDGTIAPLKPDIFDGSLPEKCLKSVRDEIGHHIMPSSMHDRPLAPNFFIEVKGRDGSAAVATRQARYAGTIGARAMHTLQNYGKEQRQYDGQAYAFTSTYHDDTLKIYAHHPTALEADKTSSRYHITQIQAYAMTNDRDTFIRGTTAFRNTRDLAMRYRDDFILAANSRASHHGPTANEGAPTTAQLNHDDEESDEFHDCDDYSPSRTPKIRATDVDKYSKGSSSSELGNMTTDLETNFTSDSHPERLKRSRQLLSPDSKTTGQGHPSKSRRPRGVGRNEVESEPS